MHKSVFLAAAALSLTSLATATQPGPSAGEIRAALAVERLPAAKRPMWRAGIARLLWETRELDGGWNDRIFPRTNSYSTARSLLALNAPGRPALAEW